MSSELEEEECKRGGKTFPLIFWTQYIADLG